MSRPEQGESEYPDLSNCDKEPIHIPGAIQSHGFLLSLDSTSQRIESASENIEVYVGISALAALGKRLDEVFDPMVVFQINDSLSQRSSHEELESPPSVCRVKNQEFDVIIHSAGEKIIVEFEIRSGGTGQITIKKVMYSALSKIRSADSTQQLMSQFATLVREITNYDRVMVYQFHADQHGEVLAEAKLEHLEPLLHNHYPASDIPVQARALYKINLVRLIADVEAVPSRLLGLFDQNNTPLDLTHSVLRAVSPIHIEYLKNMGVRSSFSISLIYKDELWGLIACHNYSNRVKLDYDARMACRFLGQFFSGSLERRMEADFKLENSAFTEAALRIREQLTTARDVPTALTSHAVNLLDINKAEGAALFFENKMYKLGRTPTEGQITGLVDFLRSAGVAGIYQNTRISSFYNQGHDFVHEASGILLTELSDSLTEYIIWFKPEQVRNVVWAGDPNKPAVPGAKEGEKISPRTSFAKWISEIRDTSSDWEPAELLGAACLREQIGELIIKKAKEVRKLNEVLQTAYEELDTFTYTISHDLRTPLASIRNYTELVLEDLAGSLPEEAILMLQKVVGRTQKMEQLIKDVLHYTRASRQAIQGEVIDMRSLITEIVNEFREQSGNTKIKFLTDDLHAIFGDRTMIMQLFQNLIGNAVKYSAGRNHPVVTISGAQGEDQEVIYSVLDNGIGLDMQHAPQIFDLFHRLENVGQIQGTGVGLAIAKRIVDKHGGRIWLESAPDEGCSFHISLPGQQEHRANKTIMQ